MVGVVSLYVGLLQLYIRNSVDYVTVSLRKVDYVASPLVSVDYVSVSLVSVDFVTRLSRRSRLRNCVSL